MVLLRFTTYRRLEEASALISIWYCFDFSNFSLPDQMQSYDGWTGKAERPLAKWVSPRLTLFAVDPVEGQDREVLCPLRAFLFLFINTKRKYSGEAFIILRLCNFFSLSYSIIFFTLESPCS